MPKAYITVGISASGKSTWAREFQETQTEPIVEINRDMIRWVIMESKDLVPCWANWKWKWEKQVTEIAEKIQENAIAMGHDMIFSDTNLNKHRRENLKAFLEKEGYDVEIIYFEVDYDEAVRRDAAREHGVGPWVIAQQYDRWCKEFQERPVNSEKLPHCVLVDIDGTVALMNGRSPYDWDKVDTDVDHAIVCQIVRGLMMQGDVRIIFFSGRDGSCFDKTKGWLDERFGDLSPIYLHMRQAGDQRNDAIVKEEMYREHIDGRFHVRAVIDDRPRVCKMWRRLGFSVIQVGNPYIDF